MIHEDRIQALLAEAAPLRLLDDDDPGKVGLAPLVDEINGLRAMQDAEAKRALLKADIEADLLQEPKRGPGRPRKDA